MSRVRISFPAPNEIPHYFFIFCIYCRKRLWRYSQVVRQGSAKPLLPGSNPGGASNRSSVQYGAFILLSPLLLPFALRLYRSVGANTGAHTAAARGHAPPLPERYFSLRPFGRGHGIGKTAARLYGKSKTKTRRCAPKIYFYSISQPYYLNYYLYICRPYQDRAAVVELADARDLKSFE